MRELVVISGKGGTGKTSVASALAVLWQRAAVVVDCDVDAPDLHLVLQPEPAPAREFVGGEKAILHEALCTACGRCVKLCRFDAIAPVADARGRPAVPRIDPIACEGCGVCARFCPRDALEMVPVVNAEWFVAPCRAGMLIHARMRPGAENSGKLVTQLRQAAAEVARHQGQSVILCDGSPGVGCPVIASLTGADLALIVTEPTPSGLHDFRRVARLAARLSVPSLLVVNKADLHESLTRDLESAARDLGVEPWGRLPYDHRFSQALRARRTVVELGPAAAPLADAVRELAHRLAVRLEMPCDAGRAAIPTGSQADH
jgi:MinD superfamily P-loop ATPase